MSKFNNLLSNQYTPFWLITISILIVLTLPMLIQDGMFMDSVLYTSVSHNLSQGIGTFWFPQFSLHSVGGLLSFHEQPPLVFGIQALFFKFFGDSMYVERFYTFLTLCITAFLIHKLWKIIFESNDLSKLSWFPIIFWITVPVCFWSYTNNMHENTMGIFTLLSVITIYKALKAQNFNFILWVVAGIFIFLATLCKGIPGLFPITVPFLFWITHKKHSFSKLVLQSVIVLGIPVLIYAILLLFPFINESLSTYLFKRALHRMNEVPTTDSRFYIIGRLFMELLPQILLAILVFSIAQTKKIKTTASAFNRTAVFFILVGLSASAPLMLTLVQKGFYFVPALPFFAIGFAVLIAPYILILTSKINSASPKFRVFLIASILVLIGTGTFSFMQMGKTKRDREILHDVYIIGKTVPKQTIISIPTAMWNEWELQCYIMRYYTISLSPKYKSKYYLIKKSMTIDSLTNYKKVNLETEVYDLYEQKKMKKVERFYLREYTPADRDNADLYANL